MQTNMTADILKHHPGRDALPDAGGHFGIYGGMYVAETLMQPLLELRDAYMGLRLDAVFQKQLNEELKVFAGRPTGLYFAERLTKKLGGAKIYLKREDLLHTGAHKINNCVGQALVARHMGKKRVIAETGAGQHGTATAAVAARFGMKCRIYMGSEDMRRQALNVYRMKLCGAEVIGVDVGQKTLKEAINEAMRDWVANCMDTHYILGTVYGSHPYPMMVRDFQSVIGHEARAQMLEREGRLPDEIAACIGGGSNAMGLFFAFLEDKGVRLTGVEAGGRSGEVGEHAARFDGGRLGVLQGCRTFILQDPEGQIGLTHSVSAGLDYAAIGPEHAYYRDLGRIQMTLARDSAVLKAFRLLAETEGIIPALESTHAVAYAIERAPQMSKDQILLLNLSGRGDKDVQEVARILGEL